MTPKSASKLHAIKSYKAWKQLSFYKATCTVVNKIN